MTKQSFSGRFLAVAVFLSLSRCLISADEVDKPAASVTLLTDRPRMIVLTDIGGDPDDQQSMIRLMLYANQFDIEGMIASASGTPGELKEKTTRSDLIRQIVEAYGEVQPNLARHAQGYPDASDLLRVIKSGNSSRGQRAIGAGHDTEGSQWIISVVDRQDPRPVNIAIWGGQTDLAQALWRVRRDRGPLGLDNFVSRIRVHDIADQDGIAEYIWREFPGLFYVLDKAPQGRDKREAVFRGMYLGGDLSLTSRSWIDSHVRHDHGPLGALYPDRTWTAPNPHSALKEGDTPSWFYFLPTGLNDPEHPQWGGWGGRFQRDGVHVYRDAKDRVGDVDSARATVWRWRPAFQHEFQARMDWCVASPDEANHAPTAICNNVSGRQTVHLSARPGERVLLDATGSHDPDGDALQFRWWIYPEPSSGDVEVVIENADQPRAMVKIPPTASAGTVHVILEVSDTGAPALTAYSRIVIDVRPM